jgi:four helix bundle protein
MRDFRKYEVWRLSHELVLEVYSLSKSFPNSEMYGITSQLRRASVSIPTNISEGCGRSTDKEFVRYIHIALGSAHEVEYLSQLSFDLQFFEEGLYEALNQKINTVKRKLFQLEKKINET